MVNNVVLAGRLVADPEHRQTQTGKGVANLRIAVDRKGREKETDFFNVTAWGQSADFACTYLSKGRLVAVTGRLQVRSYTDKEGQNKQAFEIVADTIQPLDSMKRDETSAPVQSQPSKGKSAPALDMEIEDPFAE